MLWSKIMHMGIEYFAVNAQNGPTICFTETEKKTFRDDSLIRGRKFKRRNEIQKPHGNKPHARCDEKQQTTSSETVLLNFQSSRPQLKY
jgi:hypothetical protein